MNCIFRDFTSWWPTKDPPHDKFLVPHTLSRCDSNGSNMFKPNNQLWTPLISSSPKTQPPSDCLASYVNLKAARQLGDRDSHQEDSRMIWGDPKMTNVMGKMMINRDILGYTKKTSDFISETPDLFQFVVPTKAATNKQHNSTRWWVSVLSWFPHQLYISHKPYGISYTNAKFASSLNFKSLDVTTMPCLLPHQPGCLYIQSHLLWF